MIQRKYLIKNLGLEHDLYVEEKFLHVNFMTISSLLKSESVSSVHFQTLIWLINKHLPKAI